jgi:hypothetical protein
MSRILRRPMFRGGPASSDGVGITSGLNDGYATGGRVGYQTAGPVGDSTFAERFKNAMEQTNANEEARYDLLKSDESYDLANINFKDIYNALNPPSSEILKRLQERQKERPLMDKISDFVLKPISASQLTYRTEAEKQAAIAKEYEAKIAAEKAAAEKEKLFSPASNEEVTKRQTLPTLSEDIDTYSKLLMDNAGPDKDEYTRQKYLTLAKFGLNLLKPTPVGIKPSLATSLASAAEKPLEEYGNISMQQSKEDRALRQAAVQLGIQKHMPSNIAKGIQDLMSANPKMTVEEATSIVTTGKNLATIQKEQRASLDATRSRLETNPNLKGLAEKDPASLNLLAKLIDKGNIDDTQIKGDYSKYNKYVEDSYYTNVPNPTTGLKEVARYSKGKFYYRGEPGFFIKQTGI